MKNKSFIARDSFFQRRVSDFDIAVAYQCDNNTKNKCSLNEEDSGSYGGYFLAIEYNGFRLLHNETIPLQKNKRKFRDSQFFSFDYLQFRVPIWRVIRYKEIKGLFTKIYNKLIGDEEYEFVDGYISDSDMFVIDDYNITEKNDTYKIVYRLMLSNTYGEHIQYTRKTIGIFDVVGNICSLIPLLNFISSFLFKFYSSNFNNYKIVEKILENDKKIFREIELTPIELTDKNKSEKNEDKLLINDTVEDGEIDDDIPSQKLFEKIPKFRFIQFYLNNIDLKCCKRNKAQRFIDICNKILYKYMSIDYILYTMIKLEKLFQDYNWNDPSLNNLESNELIIKLKQLY